MAAAEAPQGQQRPATGAVRRARPPARRRCNSERSGSGRRAAGRDRRGRRQRAAGAGGPPGAAARRPARRSRCSSSRCTSLQPEGGELRLWRPRRGLAPPRSPRESWRNASRSRRFARFRCTAPPTRRLTARPSRSASAPFAATTSVNSRPSRRWPRLNTRSNSAFVLRRWRGRKRAGMPHGRSTASGRETLAALLATALQHELAPLRPHADEESVGALATAVVGLERPLHADPLARRLVSGRRSSRQTPKASE